MFKHKKNLWMIMYKSVSKIHALNLVDSFSRILYVATERNRRDGITGFLAYDRGHFFQILEGPREAVAACFARIGEDVRHGQVETLLEESVPNRTFGQWSMGFADASELEDYLALHKGLQSDKPSEVFKAMARMGALNRTD